MASYLNKAKKIMDQVLSYDLQQIFRSENARADRLAKLATLQMADLDDNIYLETLEACIIEEPKSVVRGLIIELDVSYHPLHQNRDPFRQQSCRPHGKTISSSLCFV